MDLIINYSYLLYTKHKQEYNFSIIKFVHMPTITKLGERILQIVTILCFSVLAYFFLKEGVGLLYAGTKGDWNISMEFTGWKLYFSSVVPGVAVVFCAVVVIIWGLPRVMKEIK